MKERYYVVFLKSDTLLDKLIRFFSSYGSKIPEYSHVVFYDIATDDEISLEIPRIKKTTYRDRSYAEFFLLDDKKGPEVWKRANDYSLLGEKYGKLQVFFKIFTMLFGLRIFRFRRDCAEFTLDCLYPETKGKNDFYTVGQARKIFMEREQIQKPKMIVKK